MNVTQRSVNIAIININNEILRTCASLNINYKKICNKKFKYTTKKSDNLKVEIWPFLKNKICYFNVSDKLVNAALAPL